MTGGSNCQTRLGLKVRPYEHGDAAAVTALFCAAFPGAVPPHWDLDRFARHWEERPPGPAADRDDISPLVLISSDGAVAGFLGVHPRLLRWRGRPVWGAVCSDLCVAEAARGFGGPLLLSTFLDGPQDLSYSDEGNDRAVALWTALGGSVCWLESLRWTVPLRPARLALSSVLRRRGPLGLYTALQHVTPLADALIRRAAAMPAVKDHAPLPIEPLEAPTLFEVRSAISRIHPAFVEDDTAGLSWKLQRLAAMRQAGALRAFVARDARGAAAGWFIYYLRRRGLSDVIEIGGVERLLPAVFEALVADAYAAGASGITGRWEPHLAGILARRFCLNQPNPRWMLIAARDPALLNDILAGRAWLTRLDGEWTHHLPAA